IAKTMKTIKSVIDVPRYSDNYSMIKTLWFIMLALSHFFIDFGVNKNEIEELNFNHLDKGWKYLRREPNQNKKGIDPTPQHRYFVGYCMIKASLYTFFVEQYPPTSSLLPKIWMIIHELITYRHIHQLQKNTKHILNTFTSMSMYRFLYINLLYKIYSC
ncbi:hypothetical protein ACJX0J_018055, partial [Zea mays]